MDKYLKVKNLFGAINHENTMKNIIIFIFLAISLSQAQNWTIQTASFRDYRLAERTMNRLIAAGFDSYSEFYMNSGKQFVRIRVGCFKNRQAAQNYLDTMHAMGQMNAYVIPHSQNSYSCIEREIGFIAPEKWGTYRIDNEKIIFWVTMADITGFIIHNNYGWQISQTGSDFLTNTYTPGRSVQYFSQTSESGPIVVILPNQSPYKLTTGKLLWQSDRVAIILEDDTVVSYKISLGAN